MEEEGEFLVVREEVGVVTGGARAEADIMLSSCAPTAVPPQDASGAATEPFRSLQIATAGAAAKKKRRPAGTPGKWSSIHTSNYTGYVRAFLRRSVFVLRR